MTDATAPEFDTLAATRELVAAGLERKHAEAIAATVRASRAGLATKADLDNLEMRLDARLDAKISGLEMRLYRALWMQGAGIVALMAALMAAFG